MRGGKEVKLGGLCWWCSLEVVGSSSSSSGLRVRQASLCSPKLGDGFCDAGHVSVRRAYVRHDYAFMPLSLSSFPLPSSFAQTLFALASTPSALFHLCSPLLCHPRLTLVSLTLLSFQRVAHTLESLPFLLIYHCFSTTIAHSHCFFSSFVNIIYYTGLYIARRFIWKLRCCAV